MKIDLIRKKLHNLHADAILVTFMPDIRWATGFTGSNGLLIVLPERSHFVTDGRYKVQAQREVVNAEVHISGDGLIKHVDQEKLLGDAITVLYQGDKVTVADLEAWRGQLPAVKWQSVTELLSREVATKSPEEVTTIRNAQAITDDVFNYIHGFIKPGMREKEVAAEIVYQHLCRGAERMSFDPIVASGPRSALPHGRPTDRRIRQDEILLIDMGCVLNGYASDMTRTLAIGDPGDEARAVYNLVLEAQNRAIEAAHGGMASAELDRVARGVIEAGGYGTYFSHGLGHGIGLQTHEWPRVSYHVEYDLPVGAAVTIEPGVYLPDQFGVRIEDIIVLREAGSDNLSASPKEWTVI